MANPIKMHTDESGQATASGLFTMHDQEGFPLMASLMWCKERGVKVDWVDFYAAANAANKKQNPPREFSHTRQMVEQAIADSGWHETFIDTVRSVYRRPIDEAICSV